MKNVIFTGCSKDQAAWGSYTGRLLDLEIGATYQIEREEVHSWHTKIYLKGITGSFNSVCFEEKKDFVIKSTKILSDHEEALVVHGEKEVMKVESIRNYENLSEILGSELGDALYAVVHKLRKSEKEKPIQLAEAQLLGYGSGRSGELITALIESAGITIQEWELLKKNFNLYYLSEHDIGSVDEHFEMKGTHKEETVEE